MTDVAATAAPKAKEEEEVPNLNLSHITERDDTERGIPLAKFIDDVDEFASSFNPPASAELLIGAYSELMNRYRVFEARLSQKRTLHYLCMALLGFRKLTLFHSMLSCFQFVCSSLLFSV